MTDNKEVLSRICGIVDAWRQLKDENKDAQLTAEQFDFVTDIAVDQISKIIAERGKA